MCNTCSNYTGGCYNYAQANTATGYGTGCGFNQRICRDCCGNIWVRQNVSICCNRCCHHCSCGNNGTSGNTNGNGGNGNSYGCFTICGRIFNGTTQNAAATQNVTTCSDGYYARQYGQYPYGRSYGCCGGFTGYTGVTTVTD